MRAKGGNTIPMVFVTTADGGKGIDAIPYVTLKADMRKSVRELRKTLEEVDVVGGAVAGDADEEEPATVDSDIPEFLEWENSSGRRITAAVKEIKDGKVHFLLQNGKTVWYDISKLSKASQEKLKAE